MSKSALSKTRKKSFPDHGSGERKLLFSYDSAKNVWYYRTKLGVWRNIRDINAYGLRYILDRLEMEERRSSEIWKVICEEIEIRRKRGEIT